MCAAEMHGAVVPGARLCERDDRDTADATTVCVLLELPRASGTIDLWLVAALSVYAREAGIIVTQLREESRWVTVCCTRAGV